LFFQAVNGLRVAAWPVIWNQRLRIFMALYSHDNCAVFPYEIQATDTLRLSASDNREVDDFAISHEAIGSLPVSVTMPVANHQCKNNE
jgi:hypothetical protein